MAQDAHLQYIISIDNRLANIEKTVGERIGSVETDVDSLKETSSRQRGVMLGGGAVVTALSGLVNWLMNGSNH